MILSDDELLQIIQKKPNKSLIEFGLAQRKKSRMHMYGVAMEEHLTMIEGFEKPWLRAVRTKYVQSNKDLFCRLTKPLVKIFSARGGSRYYNLTQKQNELASIIDENILPRTSVKKWLETHWKTHLLDDPMGLIFIEINAAGKAYPTYKSIVDIEEYKIASGKVEYVIFKVEKEEKMALGLEDKAQVYRVVDDMFDKIVYLENDVVHDVEGQTFNNFFGFVPAVINSPFVNPDGAGYISPFYWIFDLADQFLLKISIRLTHELRHGFPKYYEYADDCLNCKGTGKKAAKDCTDCKGTGKKIMMHVSDSKLLEYPTKDTPMLKGAPGGYIEPSETFWNICSQGLMELEERINQTMWGSKQNSKLKPGMGLSAAPNGIVTATEVMDNRQPEVDSLSSFSDCAEMHDKFITDCAVMIMLKVPGYIGSGGCSKSYGRRFLIEDADRLLERYMDARGKGVSPGILFTMYEQYLESRYQADGVSLSLHKKLMKIEPYMHYTLGEMSLGNFDVVELNKKALYGEWLSQMNSNTLILASVNKLKESFAEFIGSAGMMIKKEEPVKVAAKK